MSDDFYLIHIGLSLNQGGDGRISRFLSPPVSIKIQITPEAFNDEDYVRHEIISAWKQLREAFK